MNAFTRRMLAEIRHALAAAAKRARRRYRAAGEGRGFCPGMDMNALDAMSDGNGGGSENLTELKAQPGDADLGHNFQVTGYLMSIRKPVIAAINGACAGLGLAMATMTDLRIVERSAIPFAFPAG